MNGCRRYTELARRIIQANTAQIDTLYLYYFSMEDFSGKRQPRAPDSPYPAVQEQSLRHFQQLNVPVE